MTDTITKLLALRGAALEVMHCRKPECLIAGPAGTGKSFSCLYKIHLMMLANPGSKALLLRKTHVSLTQTGLVTFREQVIPEALETRLVRWYGGSQEKPPGYAYSNGSFVAVGGMDNPTKIMSSEYDIIYVQEATELAKDEWEKCTSRLRNGKISFQQLLADCNPEGPDHWLNKRCESGQTHMLYGMHTDNPKLFDLQLGEYVPTEQGRAYLQLLSNLTGVRRARLYGGIWAAAEGIVYDGWDPARHLIDRPDGLPYEWRRIWGIDWGYTNPFVWQQWAVDPDGRLILEKEIYRSQRIVADHVQQILQVMTEPDARVMRTDAPDLIDPDRSGWRFPRPYAVICDHDAEDRATFEREMGIGTTAASKGVKDGIDAVTVRLRIQPDGLPRLMILRDSLVDRDESVASRGLPLGLPAEITSYVWEPAPDGKLNKDRPLKLNDHSCDTGRYVVMSEDVKLAPRIRWL